VHPLLAQSPRGNHMANPAIRRKKKYSIMLLSLREVKTGIPDLDTLFESHTDPQCS
jgi:hypothetical protein